MKTDPSSRYLIVILSCCNLLAMADRSVFTAAAPVLVRRFALTGTQLGVLLGPAFAVTYGVAAILFGAVADRGRVRPLIVAGLAITIAAALTNAAAAGYADLLAGRLMLGVGQGAVIPAAMLLVAHGGGPGLRPRALATFTAASALGRSLGLLSAGAVLGLVVGGIPALPGWRMALLAGVVPAAVLLLLCWRRVPGMPARPVRTIGVPVALLPYFLVGVAPVVVGQSVAAWGPTLLVGGVGLSAAAAAGAMGAIVLVFAPGAQALGAAMVGRLVWTRDHPILAATLCLLAAEPLLMLAGLSHDLVPAATGLAGVTLLGGAAAFIMLHAVQHRAPSGQRGAVTGSFLALVTLAGYGSGPLLTGMIGDLHLAGAQGAGPGIALPLIGAGAIVASGAVLAVGAWGRHHARPGARRIA